MLTKNRDLFCQICSSEINDNIIFLDCFHFLCSNCVDVYKKLDMYLLFMLFHFLYLIFIYSSSNQYYSILCKICIKTTLLKKQTEIYSKSTIKFDLQTSSTNLSDTINSLKSQIRNKNQISTLSISDSNNHTKNNSSLKNGSIINPESPLENYQNFEIPSLYSFPFEFPEQKTKQSNFNLPKDSTHYDSPNCSDDKLSPKFADFSPKLLCILHNEQLTMFCKEDKSFCCTICILQNSHKNHKTIPVQKALNLIVKENKLISTRYLRKIHTSLENELEKTQFNLKFLESSLEAMLCNIKEEFDLLYKRLKIKEDKLINKANNFFSERKNQIQTMTSHLYFLRTLFSEKFNIIPDFEEADLVENVNFFRSYQELSHHLALIPKELELPDGLDNNIVEFTTSQKNKVIEAIDNFGKFIKTTSIFKERSPNKIEKKNIRNSKSPNTKKNDFSNFTEIPDNLNLVRLNTTNKRLNSEGKCSFGKKMKFSLENKDLFYDSLIMKSELRIPCVFLCVLPEELVNKQNVCSSLLYRLSKDGVGSITFHLKCDGKNPIIGFIKAGKCIFGFYSEIPFRQMEENVVFEGNCWIFSIKNKQGFHPMKFKRKESGFALIQKTESPIFGKNDLYIKY